MEVPKGEIVPINQKQYKQGEVLENETDKELGSQLSLMVSPILTWDGSIAGTLWWKKMDVMIGYDVRTRSWVAFRAVGIQFVHDTREFQEFARHPNLIELMKDCKSTHNPSRKDTHADSIKYTYGFDVGPGDDYTFWPK